MPFRDIFLIISFASSGETAIKKEPISVQRIQEGHKETRMLRVLITFNYFR